MDRFVPVCVSLLCLAAAASPAAAGSTYQYEDPEGVVHYTNVPGDPRYAFVRKDAEAPAPKPAAERAGGPSQGIRAFAQVIRAAAERYGVDTRLVEAIVQTESAGNPTAVSPKGAYGLMQLLPETARRFGLNRKKDLLDPKKNLEAGVKYLKWLTNRFGGDAEKILAAYNAGEGAVQRFGGIPPYQETQSYVQKIFGLLGVTTPAPVTAPAPAGQEAAR